MKIEFNQKFDIHAVLRIKGLDIHKVAKDNPYLLIGEYYDHLLEFINNSVDITNILKKIADIKANDKDFKHLVETRAMLENIGCTKFLSDIDDMIKLNLNKSRRRAADISKILLDNISSLILQITEAKNVDLSETEQKELEEIVGPADETQYAKGANILSQYLKRLAHDEANRKMIILAVDDVSDILNTINSTLSEEYKVYTIAKPTMIKTFLQQVTPELILLDYDMPEVSGFELVPIIRSYKEHKDTPIIFLTSKDTKDYVTAAFSLGACDYIVKPIKDDILLNKVKKHIRKKKLL